MAHGDITGPLKMRGKILSGTLDFVPELQHAVLGFARKVPWWLWVEHGALALDEVSDSLKEMEILRVS